MKSWACAPVFALLALALVPGIQGCAAPSELGGSVSEVLDLDFDLVRLRKRDHYLLVEYLRQALGESEKPCKVIVDLYEMEATSEVELVKEALAERVTLTRATLANDEFPEVASGEVEIEGLDFADHGYGLGRFTFNFVGGYDLKGRFDGDIEEVGGP